MTEKIREGCLYFMNKESVIPYSVLIVFKREEGLLCKRKANGTEKNGRNT